MSKKKIKCSVITTQTTSSSSVNLDVQIHGDGIGVPQLQAVVSELVRVINGKEIELPINKKEITYTEEVTTCGYDEDDYGKLKKTWEYTERDYYYGDLHLGSSKGPAGFHAGLPTLVGDLMKQGYKLVKV